MPRAPAEHEEKRSAPTLPSPGILVFPLPAQPEASAWGAVLHIHQPPEIGAITMGALLECVC